MPSGKMRCDNQACNKLVSPNKWGLCVNCRKKPCKECNSLTADKSGFCPRHRRVVKKND